MSEKHFSRRARPIPTSVTRRRNVETINGTGERKLTCSVFGEPVVKAFCAVVDGQRKRPGDSWTVALANGTLTETCLPNGAVHRRVACVDGASPTPDGTACSMRANVPAR